MSNESPKDNLTHAGKVFELLNMIRIAERVSIARVLHTHYDVEKNALLHRTIIFILTQHQEWSGRGKAKTPRESQSSIVDHWVLSLVGWVSLTNVRPSTQPITAVSWIQLR